MYYFTLIFKIIKFTAIWELKLYPVLNQADIFLSKMLQSNNRLRIGYVSAMSSQPTYEPIRIRFNFGSVFLKRYMPAIGRRPQLTYRYLTSIITGPYWQSYVGHHWNISYLWQHKAMLVYWLLFSIIWGPSMTHRQLICTWMRHCVIL